MLRVDKTHGSSKYTVSEVVNRLKSKYDLCALQNSVIAILGNEYVI